MESLESIDVRRFDRYYCCNRQEIEWAIYLSDRCIGVALQNGEKIVVDLKD